MGHSTGSLRVKDARNKTNVLKTTSARAARILLYGGMRKSRLPWLSLALSTSLVTGIGTMGCSVDAEPVTAPAPPAASTPPASVPSCDAPRLDDGPELPLDDLVKGTCAARALDAIIGDASVVCLAESSHGVAESTRVDAVLARHLIVDLGFRVVAYEDSDAALRGLDAFVNDGDEAALDAYLDDAGETLANTHESAELLRGIAKARIDSKDKLSLRGIDVAIAPAKTRAEIGRYLDQVDPTGAAALKAKLTASNLDVAVRQVKEVSAHLQSERAAYVARSSERAFDLCATDLESLADGYAFMKSYEAGDFKTGNGEVRDPSMGRNLIRLAREGKRVLVRAHLGHCAKDFPSQGYAEPTDRYAFGKAVAGALGDRYRVIAHLYGVGDERYQSGKTGRYTNARGSLDAALDALDSPARARLMPIRGTTPLDFDKPWKLTRMPEKVTLPAHQADALVFVKAPTPVTLGW